ncbi:MAG TPA: hypothetical protein VNJ08_17015 [Bacteriovoracaceae bacterium]|nr:hypothetical protein [Bacteriovoracaceae bacterium]
MIILLKFMVSIVAFIYRHTRNEDVPKGDPIKVGETKGLIHYEIKKSEVRYTLLSFPLPSEVIFKLTEETFLDGIMKLSGFAVEAQTGYGYFDKVVYIASDDPGFTKKLKEEDGARELAIKLITLKNGTIYCKGKYLVFLFKGDKSHDMEIREQATSFYKIISTMDRSKRKFVDEFGKKILLVEAFIYSLAAYALTGAAEIHLTERSIYLNEDDVIYDGIKWGAILAVMLLGFISYFLSRSSRGSRVIIESALVLGLSLPIGGMNLIADINRLLDRQVPVIVFREIKKIEQQVHRTRRGRTYYTYSLQMNHSDPANETIIVPKTMMISAEDYNRAAGKSTIKLEIGKGFFKKPYYRRMGFI